MPLSLNRSQLRAAFTRLRVYFAEALEPEEIAAHMGFDWADYEDLVKKFYEHEAQTVRDKPTEQVYVEYCLAQAQNVSDLTKILGQFRKTSQHSAMVSAIRARSDIYDKMIARGQEFGFIEKKPEAKIIAGVLVNQLTDKDLRAAITGQLGHLDELMTKYGGGSNIIDIDPGPSHLPTPKRKALPDGKKVKGHARNRVHKGRRVVRGGEPPL